MPLPEPTGSPRVIYNKNPLREVITQIRFPPILRIDSAVPADFQERIRQTFPNYVETEDGIVESIVDMGEGLPAGFRLPLPFQPTGTKNYNFVSEDNLWKINLTRTFLSLSTIKYRRWKTFREMLEGPVNALNDLYKPTNFARIGLRYINVIKRSDLGLSGVSWTQLIQPFLLGALGAAEITGDVRKFESAYEIALEDTMTQVRLVAKIIVDDTGEECFVVDADFNKSNRMPVGDCLDVLDYLNLRSSRLIRWVITPELHKAMEPQPYD